MYPRNHPRLTLPPMARCLYAAICALLSLTCSGLQAEQLDLSETDQRSAIEPSFDTNTTRIISEPADSNVIFSLLDQPQQIISSGIYDVTKTLDEFFSDEKVEYESNGSYIRMTGDMVFSKTESPGFVGDLKAKLELPNTQKKLKLVFESDPKEDRDEIDRALDNNPLDAAEEKSYFAGIEGLWGEFRHWKFRPSIGLKLSSRLDSFVRLRANRDYHINDEWKAYLRNTLYWFDSSGHGFDSSLEFDHPLTQALTFRSTLSASWKQENTYWELNQLFSMTQSLGERQAIIYQAGVYGVSEPRVFATDYLLQARYRRQLHSDYLFLELIPKIQYQREDNFAPFYSLTLRMEMVFKG